MTGAEYVADICKRLDQAERVPFRRVSPEGWRPKVAECHQNVDAWVKANPGTAAVRGWVTYASFGDLGVGLTAHSVVQDTDGRLFDITPLLDESLRRGMRFVRHVGDEAMFFAAKKISVSLNCPCSEGAG